MYGQTGQGVFRCSPNGGTPERLATVKEDEQAQSPQMLLNGSAVLFAIAKIADGRARWDKAQIVVQTITSGARKTLINGDDGKEAIVWVYELGGASAMRRLTIGGRSRFPVWSADGQRIAHQADRDGDLAIFWQRADGTGPVERLTKPERGDAHIPESWSPDGKHLSFAVAKGSSFPLWTLSVDDTQSKPYGGVQSANPIGSVFSPDGRWIAYASSPSVGGVLSPNRGVFVQPFPATGAVYQVPRQQLDYHPVWGPKGTELFYVPSSTTAQLASVTVAAQPVVTFGTPVTVPATVTAGSLSRVPRVHDMLPDGRLVGLVSASERQPTGPTVAPQVRVVLNWTEELKQRVPTR